LDAIQQAFSHGVKKLIIGIGSSDKSHSPDNPFSAQEREHMPTFTHVISDNPRVNDQFDDKIIIQPQNNLPIRASDIRHAIIHHQDHIIQQYLSPEVINYLQTIQAEERMGKLLQQKK